MRIKGKREKGKVDKKLGINTDSINYDGLIPYLVQSIKELANDITVLKGRMDNMATHN